MMRAAWVRKLEDRLIVPASRGVKVFFRSPLPLNNLQRKVSEFKKDFGCEHAQVKQLDEDRWSEERAAVQNTVGAVRGHVDSADSPTGGSSCVHPASSCLARRSPAQNVMELLPALTRAERHNVLFKLALMDHAAIVCRETQILETKAHMQRILLERPLCEWGAALAPYVRAAKAEPQFRSIFYYDDACLEGLMFTLAHPPHEWGYQKTRNPALDPPVKVLDIKKTLFPTELEPWKWPADPPRDAGQYFCVILSVQDSRGEWSQSVRVPYKHFAENHLWAQSVRLNFADWAATQDRWRYGSPGWQSIYSFLEHQEWLTQQRRKEEFPLRGLASRLNYEEEAELARWHEKRKACMVTVHVHEEDEEVDPEVLELLRERKAKRVRC